MRGSGRFDEPTLVAALKKARLNPLHCGAVVASKSDSVAGPGAGPGLNPLHCGAVVTSVYDRHPTALSTHVSIPFIAGQWSLQEAERRAARLGAEFQSPSLRGSGHFRLRADQIRFRKGLVSIPFIAGQWSLPIIVAHNHPSGDAFQSPSLRGSGHFPL